MSKNQYTFDMTVVGDIIKKLSDIVVPSMGAKGRMAIIDRGMMERPIITDDGVTIAKEARNIFEANELPIYTLCIEAMHNVEKTAFDGTTLTILMIQEFYNYAMKLSQEGKDAHVVSETIKTFAGDLVNELNKKKVKVINDEIVCQVATVSSKMPVIGRMIASAYKTAGAEMNIVIEHDRQAVSDYQHTIVIDSGFVLDMDGYYGDEFAELCTDDKKTKTEFENARLVLLSAGSLELNYAMGFFQSIPVDRPIPPLVFFISRTFDPKSLQIIINTLVNTSKARADKGIEPIKFQFVMLNSSTADRRFLDTAAYTGGTIQDATLGTKAYKFENCGYAAKIIIEKNRTTIIAPKSLDNRVAVNNRVASYDAFLKSRKYDIGHVDEVDVRRSIAALTKGVVKLLIATPTRTEFELIRLKLDDAIGTVQKVCQNGYLLGCGKALMNVADSSEKYTSDQKRLCYAPMENILKNAGVTPTPEMYTVGSNVYDVNKGKIVSCEESGIYDSFDAYKEALLNASSIVAQLVLGFVYIFPK